TTHRQVSPEEARQALARVQQHLEAVRPPLHSPFTHQMHVGAVRDAAAQVGPAGLADLSVEGVTGAMLDVMAQDQLAPQMPLPQQYADHFDRPDAAFLTRGHLLIFREVWPAAGSRPNLQPIPRDSTMTEWRDMELVESYAPAAADERYAPGPMTYSP